MQVVDLCYEEFGSENAKPLIILHGFFASGRNWRQVAEKFSSRFHVYVVDLRNHGASAHHPVMDYPAMAADLLQFIHKHQLSELNILGHSMGGKVAMWFALHQPELVAKLIVVDIAPVSYEHSFEGLIAALKALPLADLNTRKEAELMLVDIIPELSYRQFLLQNLVLLHGKYSWRIDLDVFAANAPNIAAFPETKHLPAYTGQALFLAGEKSNYVNAGQLQNLFPGAGFTVIAGAGHWLHVQQPVLFFGQVSKFLEKN
jgi:esterase